MWNQAQTTKAANKLLNYNKPSLAGTVVKTTFLLATILLLSPVAGAALEVSSEATGNTYLALFTIVFILFLSVKLISGIVKYLRTRR